MADTAPGPKFHRRYSRRVHDETFALWARATAGRRQGRRDAAAERRLEAAFACSQRLAVYGTLAPGEIHADQLSACPGTWSRGSVTGRRGERAHPVFTFDPAAPPVPVQLLESPALAGQWPRLDAFEGAAYRRILVPVRRGPGDVVLANLYEAVCPVGP